MSKRILFICNETVTVINFRSELIRYLTKHDYIIDVLCADDKRTKEIKDMGVDNVYVVSFANRGINPFTLRKLEKEFIKVIKLAKHDIVFTFESKPNVIGAIAAHKCKINNIVSMVEGLGNPFMPTNFKGRILRKIAVRYYKKAFKHNKLVIFLNNDDKKECLDRKIVKEEQTLVIPGIGIDTNLIKAVASLPKEKKVVMLCRLTKNKGIEDFCKVAELVRKERKDISFELYGDEQDVKKEDLQKYIDNGSIVYGGFTNNPLDIIAQSTIYISTSFYREGFPRTLLEAMALAKPIIATDTVGSRDAIKDGVNGYMLHIHDVYAFKDKILDIIDDEKELTRIGESARKYCEENYQSDVINEVILKHLDLISK